MKVPFFKSDRQNYHHGNLKDALLEAARILIAERGAAGFTLAEAAKRVGVTGAAPYRHFSDRQALMSALAVRGFDQLEAELTGAYNNGQPDIGSALVRMGDAFLHFSRQEPGLYAAMFLTVEESQEALSHHAGRTFSVLQMAIGDLLRLRHRSVFLAGPLARQIFALAHGIASLTRSHRIDVEDDPNALLQNGAKALIAGALAQNADAHGKR